MEGAGAEKRDPAHPTLQLFLDYISQNIPIDVERRDAMDCRIGFGFTLAIGVLQRPVPLDSGRLGMVDWSRHVGDERRQGLGKRGLGGFD